MASLPLQLARRQLYHISAGRILRVRDLSAGSLWPLRLISRSRWSRTHGSPSDTAAHYSR